MSGVTLLVAVQSAKQRIRDLAKSDSARLDAEILLAHALQKNRSYLYTWPEKVLTPEQLERFDTLLTQRLSGQPIAYIIGHKEFWA